MSEIKTHTAIVRTFLNLRPNGVPLGIDELLAAIKLLEDGFVDAQKPDEVLRVLRLLWCKGETHEWRLNRLWQSVWEEQALTDLSAPSTPQKPDQTQPNKIDTNNLQQIASTQTDEQSTANPPELSFLPFKPPISLSSDVLTVELQTYWPVSKRFMSYIWRYLRQPAYEGAGDVLDIYSTIEVVARTGFFVEPVYHRRIVNKAHLLLLLDHRGSMMPFHRYLRDMVDTLNDSEILVENRAVYYFENVPGTALFQTAYLTKPVEQMQILRFIDHTTSVLIVSDAGAARGRPRNRQRVRGTLDFLFNLYERSRFVAWLNPMPYERWENTSAEAIASSVPMFPMDEHGFSRAIDILSGRVALSQTKAL